MTESENYIELEPELLVTQDVWDAMGEMEEKYRHLVWYVRHNLRKCDEEAWDLMPDQIRQDALKAAVRIEKDYPDEVKAIWDENTGDWNYGFNSGVLATLRFAMLCISRVTPPVEEGEEDDGYKFGGLEDALDEFPDLDT
jgi:hypothetical protein